MRNIHCPEDIGLVNTFGGEDCEKEQYYNNCYHCWNSAIAKSYQEHFKKALKESKEDNVELVIRLPKDRYSAICKFYDTFPSEMKEWGIAVIKEGVELDAYLRDREVLNSTIHGGLSTAMLRNE